MMGRVRRLESYGLARETEPYDVRLPPMPRALRELDTRNDIIKTMHRAREDHGLAGDRGISENDLHGGTIKASVVGRVLAKGLAGDEMGERIYLVVDGVDGRSHYVETADAQKVEAIGRGQPIRQTDKPPAADLNIRDMTDEASIYRPATHLQTSRAKIERIGGDPEAFNLPCAPARSAAPRGHRGAHRRRSLEDTRRHRRAWHGP
jgi:hypothetical protein